MRTACKPAVALLALGFGACYRAVVDTGRAPSPTVVEKPWTSTFVYGLVPAAEIDTAVECPGGVARVETHQSFVNGLVALVSLGIYTPQHVRITCAATGTSARPDERVIDVGGVTAEHRAAAVSRAAALADSIGASVVVRF